MNSIKNFPYNNNGAVSEIPTLPIGTIIPYSTASAPDGYLSCNGAAISRETYKKLFAIIGTTYGEGDGSTTFNLPNLSGAVIPTDSNIAVMGNGVTLGLTNGQDNYGITYRSQTDSLSPRSSLYGLNVGSTNTAGTSSQFISFGITTDSSKSGIVGTLTSKAINYYIKY